MSSTISIANMEEDFDSNKSSSYESVVTRKPETIGDMINGTKRNLDNISTMSSPNDMAAKKAYLNKIEPVLIRAGEGFIFDRSDCISFDSKIIEITNAEIKFTKLDKFKNLLIFPKSYEDVEAIMNCEDLFRGLKKIDFNRKDNRPKLVIKGLSYSQARTHYHSLEMEGIVELINLSKDDRIVNIVKVVMENEEAANDLLDKRYLKILQREFLVVKDKPKQKFNQMDMFNSLSGPSFNPLTNSSAPFQPITANSAANDPKTMNAINNNNNMSINELASNIFKLFGDLNKQIDFKLDRITTQNRKELKEEINQIKIINNIEIKKCEKKTINIINNNNENMASAITEVINFCATNGSITNTQTLQIINHHCKIDSEEADEAEDEELNSWQSSSLARHGYGQIKVQTKQVTRIQTKENTDIVNINFINSKKRDLFDKINFFV